MQNIIERRFSRAINNYDLNAHAQSIISDKLFNLLRTNFPLLNKCKILEIGCGTGNLTLMLNKLNPEKLIINDICNDYSSILQEKLGNINFISANGETILDNITEKFQLIASSSAIQWFNNPLEFIDKCSQRLTQDGIIAISSFLPDNLFQLKDVWDIESPVKYHSLECLRNGLTKKYNIICLEHEHITLHFNNGYEILKHLKNTGVNSSVSKKIWTKSALTLFNEKYNHLYGNNIKGLPLTYSPVWIIARKKRYE